MKPFYIRAGVCKLNDLIPRLESVPICVRSHLGFLDCPIIAVIVVVPRGLDLQADNAELPTKNYRAYQGRNAVDSQE